MTNRHARVSTPDHSGRHDLDDLKSRLLGCLQERFSGELPPSEFLAQLEDLLSGFPLYPRDQLLQIGISVGDVLERDPAAAVETVLQMMGSSCDPVRALAACAMWRLARFQPGLWEEAARHLVQDENWDVRDLAAHVFDTQAGEDGAAEFHRDYVNERLERWVADSDYLVRRAATQALLGFATRHPDVAASVLQQLNPLLDDSAEYVRRGLAMTLRTLGRRNPLAVIEFIEDNLTAPSDQARETVELALENSFADRFPEQKKRILERLHAGPG